MEDHFRDHHGPGHVGWVTLVLRLALRESDLRAAGEKVENSAMKIVSHVAIYHWELINYEYKAQHAKKERDLDLSK